MTENINPMEFLKEEMESDENSIRINAMHRIKTVAVLIGPDATKNQLLPYLDNVIKKEEDEVLFAIAEELGSLGQAVSSPIILLPYLENLATVEETVVRDMSVKSLIKLSSSLSDGDVISHLVPLILRLATNQVHFTSRGSSVNLIYSVYPRAGKEKEKLRQRFWALAAEDDTPMIKRSIASKIGDLAKVIEKEFLLSELIPCFKQLAGDDQDMVRVLCLDNLKFVAKILSKEENKQHTLPILKSLPLKLDKVIIAATEDKSWRVRLALSKNFAELAEAFGKEITDISLINIFIQLLKDAENEVKLASISSLSQFVKHLSLDKLPNLIPVIQLLAKDTNSSVRSGIAEVMGGIIPPVGKDITKEKLLPHLVEMFSDENTDVRISVIKAATKYVQVAGADVLMTIGPHFKNLVQDLKWRVRLEVINGAADLGVFFHNLDVFTKHLEVIYLSYLKDKTYSVREAGWGKLKGVVQVYKSDWVSSRLLPQLVELISKDSGYLYRITGFYSFQATVLGSSAEFINDKIMPVLQKSYKDPVPNVRIVILKIFKSIASIVPDKSKINSLISEFINDQDKDVAYFAQEALA